MWAEQLTVELATGARIGIRVNTSEVAAILRRVLGDRLVEGDGAHPNLSIRIEPTKTSGRRPLHTVHRGCALVARTRHPVRAARALLAHLDALSAADRGGRPRLATLALEHRGGLVLAPSALRARIDRLEPRLRAAGIAVVDHPLVELDVERAGLAVVPDLDTTTWNLAALAELDGDASGAHAAGVAAGRYPVRGRVVIGPAPASGDRLRHSLAELQNLARTGPAPLAIVRELARLPHVAAASPAPAEVTAAVLAVCAAWEERSSTA